MCVAELEPKDFLENTVLVNLTDNYDAGDDDFERYEAARGCWKISEEHAKQCDLVMAVHDGKIIEIYRPVAWFDAEMTMRLPKKVKSLSAEELKKRREFVGRIVTDSEIRGKYLGQGVKSMFAPPKQNPVRCIIAGKLVSE